MQIDRQMGRQTDKNKYNVEIRQIDRQIDRYIDRWVDIDRKSLMQMDQIDRIDGQIDKV